MIVRVPFTTIKWKIKRVKPKARLYSRKEQAVFAYLKGEQYQRNAGICPHCGGKFELQDMSIHHMLPLALFPELKNTADNFLLVCNECHKAIHNNAYLTCHYMEIGAKKLNIDISTIKPCAENY